MKRSLVLASLFLCLVLPSSSLSVDCPMKEPMEIEAKEYWHYLHEGKFQQTTEDENFIYGVAYFHCDAKVKINKTALKNRQEKETAYINILRDSVIPMSEQEDKHRSKAKELTGMDFETQMEWVKWWSENSNRLELSEDGSILVVKRCKKSDGLDKVIAKVGKRKITYDEIMDDGCDENYRNREMTALNKIIRDEVIKQEIAEMGYSPSEDEIEEKSNEINLRFIEPLGNNESERQEHFESYRKLMLTTYQALSLWKEDKEKGDEFAKKELLPFTGHTFYWEQTKKLSNNEEKIKALQEWQKFADVPSSEYMNVYMEINREFYNTNAITELKIEKLKMKVVPNYNELHEADRENEFRVWLRKRMAEKTVIYDDNYELALEIY